MLQRDGKSLGHAGAQGKKVCSCAFWWSKTTSTSTVSLTDTLKEAGYVVDQAFDGEEGHYLGEGEPYDAVILDIGLPEMDGVTVLEKWRGAGKAMPVLILTARDRWSDKVAGIDAGADDYVDQAVPCRGSAGADPAL